ncbi:MAG: hypothetical protein ACI4PF_03190, partial [Christensenellales bacterium]
MKKIWKNLCAYSMALACGVGLIGCKDDKTPVSKDLDGDGVISSWETIFDKDNTETSTPIGELTYIRNASELLAINDNIDERRIYVLSNNIDLDGKEVCINLGKSEFYGNNYVISNFKLGRYAVDEFIVDGINFSDSTEVRCLFYGGTGVYDTRVFMGLQELTLNVENMDEYTISPFVNVSYIDNISVKGKLDIKSPKVLGRIIGFLNASLLYEQIPIITTDTDGYPTIESINVSLRNVEVDGDIQFDDEDDTLMNACIGGVSSTLGDNSSIYNAYAKVNINATTSNSIELGGLVGVNNGFISTCVTTGNISMSFRNNASLENVGGVVGTNGSLAEIKNTSTNVSISFKYNDELVSYSRSAQFNYGGIAGYNAGGILEYVQSDAFINVNNVSNVSVGGLTGRSDKGIISYAICRGSITIKNALNVFASQVSGYSNKGLMEKIITTTGISVDNSEKSTTVNVGMVTIFEDVNNLSTDYSAENSP